MPCCVMSPKHKCNGSHTAKLQGRDERASYSEIHQLIDCWLVSMLRILSMNRNALFPEHLPFNDGLYYACKTGEV